MYPIKTLGGNKNTARAPAGEGLRAMQENPPTCTLTVPLFFFVVVFVFASCSVCCVFPAKFIPGPAAGCCFVVTHEANFGQKALNLDIQGGRREGDREELGGGDHRRRRRREREIERLTQPPAEEKARRFFG